MTMSKFIWDSVNTSKKFGVGSVSVAKDTIAETHVAWRSTLGDLVSLMEYRSMVLFGKRFISEAFE